MSLFKRATNQPSGRIARRLLRATFAAGAVKGAAKARIERTSGRRRIAILAAIGAALAAAFAMGRRSAQATSVSPQQPHEPHPLPDRSPLRAAEANGSSDAPDPSAQSLSDG